MVGHVFKMLREKYQIRDRSTLVGRTKNPTNPNNSFPPWK